MSPKGLCFIKAWSARQCIRHRTTALQGTAHLAFEGNIYVYGAVFKYITYSVCGWVHIYFQVRDRYASYLLPHSSSCYMHAPCSFQTPHDRALELGTAYLMWNTQASSTSQQRVPLTHFFDFFSPRFASIKAIERSMPVTLWKCWDNPKVIRPTAHPTSKACPVEGANCKQSSCRSVFWRVGKRTFGFVWVENKRANDQSYFGWFLSLWLDLPRKTTLNMKNNQKDSQKNMNIPQSPSKTQQYIDSKSVNLHQSMISCTPYQHLCC